MCGSVSCQYATALPALPSSLQLSFFLLSPQTQLLEPSSWSFHHLLLRPVNAIYLWLLLAKESWAPRSARIVPLRWKLPSEPGQPVSVGLTHLPLSGSPFPQDHVALYSMHYFLHELAEEKRGCSAFLEDVNQHGDLALFQEVQKPSWDKQGGSLHTMRATLAWETKHALGMTGIGPHLFGFLENIRPRVEIHLEHGWPPDWTPQAVRPQSCLSQPHHQVWLGAPHVPSGLWGAHLLHPSGLPEPLLPASRWLFNLPRALTHAVDQVEAITEKEKRKSHAKDS